MKPDPLGEPRNPLAVYLLLLTLVSGAGQLVSVPTSGSIEAELPTYLAHAWGGMLAFGSTCSLLGMFWQGDPRTGLVLKRIGMLTLSVAACVYALVILIAIGMKGAFVSGIVAGFGVACAFQFGKINRHIHRIIAASP